jgi:16S rRNA (adenine1518-N6/adenine1519-N6)-dimethyltransferase
LISINNTKKKLKKDLKRSLGQHFLVDKNVIKKIMELSKINDNDIVYEIGSGNGDLTNELCKLSKFVYSFEIDPYYYFYCKKNLKHDNLKLLNKDGFNTEIFNFDVFFSSLPYYESRRAIFWLCQKNFKKGIILLQREFVEKLLAPSGNKNYRAISVISQYRFSIDILLSVPRTSFTPAPRVDSVLIEIIPKAPQLPKNIINNIQFLFSFRKKNISFLLDYFDKSDQIKNCSFKFDYLIDKKIWQLPVKQIFELTMFLNDVTTNS